MGEIGSLHLHSHHIIHFNNKAERLSAISLSILEEKKVHCHQKFQMS